MQAPPNPRFRSSSAIFDQIGRIAQSDQSQRREGAKNRRGGPQPDPPATARFAALSQRAGSSLAREALDEAPHSGNHDEDSRDRQNRGQVRADGRLKRGAKARDSGGHGGGDSLHGLHTPFLSNHAPSGAVDKTAHQSESAEYSEADEPAETGQQEATGNGRKERYNEIKPAVNLVRLEDFH